MYCIRENLKQFLALAVVTSSSYMYIQCIRSAVVIVVLLASRYLVTHINEMQALVIVEHDTLEHVRNFYNLYLSDESGIYYSLSLRDIRVFITSTRIRLDLELVG